MGKIELDALGDLRKTHFSKDLNPDLGDIEVVVGGWVFRSRKLGGLVFVVLQDKFGQIQVTAKKGVVDDAIFEKINTVGNQFCLLVKGKLKEFKKAPQGVEIVPSEILILNPAIEQMPIDMTGKTMSELDTRLNFRSLDLRHPRNLAIFQIHQQMLIGIREYLYKNNFTEIVTPKIIGSATEGGTELFPIMYFDKEAYLSQSAQLFKERLSSCFEDVFELGACYRAEKSFTNRHLCEIYVLDIERAFADYRDVMEAIEGVIHHTLKTIKEKCEDSLKLLGVWDNFEVPDIPFPKYTYSDILKVLEEKFNIKLEFGEDISTEAYRKLGTEYTGYYFITKWPMSIKPFYIQYDRENPELSEGFDLQKGWLELTSGGTRVHDKELLVKNLVDKGLDPKAFESHLNSFDYGMPPHAGMGLGIARWLQIVCGLDQIKEAVMFPRTPDRLDP
jgi:nondiscriminating aspartyl-tRNA synthetase